MLALKHQVVRFIVYLVSNYRTLMVPIKNKRLLYVSSPSPSRQLPTPKSNLTNPMHHPMHHTMHHTMHQPMHVPACPSTKTQIRPLLTCRHQDYMILLLPAMHSLLVTSDARNIISYLLSTKVYISLTVILRWKNRWSTSLDEMTQGPNQKLYWFLAKTL